MIKSTVVIFSAIVGLVLSAPQVAKAMNDNSPVASVPSQSDLNQSMLSQVEICAQKRAQAKSFIQMVHQGLANYQQLKMLNSQEYSVDQIRQAKAEALIIIRQYRNQAFDRETQLEQACSIGNSKTTLRGLEGAFDRLNVQLALAEIPQNRFTEPEH